LYYCTAFERCSLMGFMYRAPGDTEPPVFGPALMWHKHATRTTSGTWMTHVWLTRSFRTALARRIPWAYLTTVPKPAMSRRAPAGEFLQDCPEGTEA
jgi:hypothetical protein